MRLVVDSWERVDAVVDDGSFAVFGFDQCLLRGSEAREDIPPNMAFT